MAKAIEFFFDFMSPFAYLAHCRLPELADRYGYELAYRPMELRAAKQAAGSIGPSTPQIPMKFRYISEDLRRWAKKYGVPIEMSWLIAKGAPLPRPEDIKVPKDAMDASLANKGTFYAIAKGQARDYVTSLWRATYGGGGLIGNEAVLREAARQMGWSPEAFFGFVRSDEAERLYAEAKQAAHDRGVFGAPTMMVDDEMWWGNDRLDLLEDYLAAHGSMPRR